MSKSRKSIETLLEEFKAELERRNYAEGSITLYMIEVRNFFFWLEIRNKTDPQEVAPKDIRDYQGYLYYFKTKKGKPLTASTQGTKLVILKTFFKLMEDSGAILFNPACDIELPKLEQRLPRNTLEDSEVREIMYAIKGENPEAIRDRLILELLYMTGVRIGELRAIQLEDVNFENTVLRIAHGKGDKPRFIPLLPKLMKMILRYLKGARLELLRGKVSSFLLIDNAGTAMDSNFAPTACIRRYLKKTGIKKNITAHSFRHTFATVLLKNGAPLRHIQKLLGHEKVRTTLVYTHLSIGDLKKAHQKYHPYEHGTLKEAIP